MVLALAWRNVTARISRQAWTVLLQNFAQRQSHRRGKPSK